MRQKLITLASLIGITITSFSQVAIQKIYREDLVGKEIKFLLDNDNQDGYINFGMTPQTFPYLEYEKYKQRIATIIEKDNDLYKLKMNDNNEIIYFKWQSSDKMPNNIGIISLLDSARVKYLNQKFNGIKVIRIEFAEDDGKFSQLDGPFNIYLVKGLDTTMMNIHITETYGPEGGYTDVNDKMRVFENAFRFEKPYVPLTKNNIEERFFIEIDKMDNKKTYIHKNLANDEFLKYDMGYSLDYKMTGIFLKVVVSNGRPELKFLSNYYSNDWLFHSYLKIKIGNTTKETMQVEGTREVLNGGKILERNYYYSPSDLQICKWIAENYNKDVLIRFYGTDYYDDLNPSDKILIAIKETYDLYKILKNK